MQKLHKLVKSFFHFIKLDLMNFFEQLHSNYPAQFPSKSLIQLPLEFIKLVALQSLCFSLPLSDFLNCDCCRY